MPAFEILEHTADVGIRAFGASLPELFANAAMGVQSLALDPEQARPETCYLMEASGDDEESLLVNWLNEVIYLIDGQRVVAATFEVEQPSPDRIRGTAHGEPRDHERHPPRLVVKAATYHLVRVTREADQWSADVYLDI